MINFGIVGCGRVANVHAKGILQCEGATLLAVCDTDVQKAKRYSDEYGGEIYTDYKVMLEKEEIDVINICTPNGLHAEMAIQAIEKGKHVIIEKPMAITLEDCDRIKEAAERRNVKATVVHQNRFNSVVQAMRKELEQGHFGKMSHGVASTRWLRNDDYYSLDTWRGSKEMQDGILMNQCIHNIDLLLWMMGPVKKVYGATATRHRDIEMEDVGVATLEFESGALGIVEGAGTMYPTDLEATFSLFGMDGTVRLGGLSMNKLDTWNFRAPDVSHEEDIRSENPPTVYGFGHKEVIKDMIDCIQTEREPSIPLEDGKKAVEVVLAIYESSKTGMPVYLND